MEIRVGIGGSTMSRTPMGMIWALIARVERAHLLAQHRLQRRRPAVCVRRVRSHGDELVQPGNSVGRLEGDASSRRERKSALRRVEPHGDGNAISRRRHGVPFMPIRSMLGSDVRSSARRRSRSIARSPARSCCSFPRSIRTSP
jgi:glutaconate CoA-transferase subunit A